MMPELYGKQSSSTEDSSMATENSNMSPPPARTLSKDRIQLPQLPNRTSVQGPLPPIHNALPAPPPHRQQLNQRLDQYQEETKLNQTMPGNTGGGGGIQYVAPQTHAQGLGAMQYPAVPVNSQQPFYHDSMAHGHVQPARYHHPQASYMGQVPNPPGTKAKRKRASPHQLALLNQIFEYTFFPSTELRNAIGKELGMAPRTIQIWFQNRRQSWRAQKNRDGLEDPPKSNDNERGGWEVLRSFQARRANGEIQEYDYMSIPAPGGGMPPMQDSRGHSDVFSLSMPQYQQHLIPAALSSNDQFNASMQQLPGLMPHAPHLITHQQPINHQAPQEQQYPQQAQSQTSPRVPPPVSPSQQHQQQQQQQQQQYQHQNHYQHQYQYQQQQQQHSQRLHDNGVSQ